jgi:hypothetical protein
MRAMQTINGCPSNNILSPRSSQYSATTVSAVINLDNKERTCSSGLR